MVTVLLDTNIVIALFAKEQIVLNKLDLTPEVYLPATVVGELFFAAFNSTRVQSNIERLESFVADCGIIECGVSVAREYGTIKANLESRGKVIPENDMWIAACSLVSGIPLVARDEHFERVEGLVLVGW